MIVTLSRQVGSGGDEIAARVAAALGLQLVDREHIRSAALGAGVPPELLHKLLYEGRRSLAAQILDSLGGPPGGVTAGDTPPPGPLAGIFGPVLPPPSISLEEAVRTIGLVIKNVASQDNVLILGQGGQVWLHDYQGTCHVQVVAAFDLRVARVAERQKLSLADARRMVQATDRARADYLARYHGARWLDPLLYHLVVNTSHTSTEAAVSLIVQAAQVVGRRP